MFWEYDTRLGRRWNVDPVDQIYISNYATFKNNPILFEDILGNTPGKTIGEKIDDIDKKVYEKTSEVAAKISEPVVKAVNKFENFVRSKSYVSGGVSGKIDFGVIGLEGKIEGYSTSETTGGINFELNLTSNSSGKLDKKGLKPTWKDWNLAGGGDIYMSFNSSETPKKAFKIFDLKKSKGFVEGGADLYRVQIKTNSLGNTKIGLGCSVDVKQMMLKSFGIKGSLGVKTKTSLLRYTSRETQLGY
jgi:hypothetical protein